MVGEGSKTRRVLASGGRFNLKNNGLRRSRWTIFFYHLEQVPIKQIP